MAKSFRQKMKILYLLKAFWENTDEEHPLTVKELMKYLEGYGISVERKTVYDDIEALRVFGMDILNRREKPSGYYLASRSFELAELKILVDAVQSSRFITSRKSGELIKKLEDQTSIYEARQLQRQVFVSNRVKTMNESIYYNVDTIHQAVSEDRQISFQYYEWTVSKEMKPRRNGEIYFVSPWYLIWKDENYYLIGLDEKNSVVKHYRVDKMRKINVETERRQGEELFRNFDVARFVSGVFGMFGGKEESLTLKVNNRLVGVVLDHFGQDVIIQPHDEEHFITYVHVNVSSQFFGWLSGLGRDAEILSPENVRKDYRNYIREILKTYE